MDENTVALIVYFILGCGLAYGLHLIVSSVNNRFDMYSKIQEERYELMREDIKKVKESYTKFLLDFKDMLDSNLKERKLREEQFNANQELKKEPRDTSNE